MTKKEADNWAGAVGSTPLDLSAFNIDLSILFGTRKKHGYAKESLSFDLKIISPNIRFKSLFGSRVHHIIHNLRMISPNESEILAVLKANDQSKRAQKLLKILTEMRSPIILRASLISFCWNLVGKRIMEQMSQIKTLQDAKDSIGPILNNCKLIASASIKTICDTVRTQLTSNEAKKSLEIFESLYESSNPCDQEALQASCKNLGTQLRNKILKDTFEIRESTLSPTTLIQLSNQRLESVFGILKYIYLFKNLKASKINASKITLNWVFAVCFFVN